MPRRLAIVAAILAVLTLGPVHIILCFRTRDPGAPPARSNRALPQEAYVWQRTWDADVVTSIHDNGDDLDGLTVLAAQVDWPSGRPKSVRVKPDYGALAAMHRPVGLAIRVSAYHGPFAADDSAGGFLGDLAASVLRDARRAAFEPCELQIDFDAASSKLGGYRVWIQAIQARVAPLPVRFTALPAWLSNPDFAALARTAGAYILQVHSVDPPTGPDRPMTLCDPVAARRWVARADAIGVPFRVALPTYGYIVAFTPDGHLIGLLAQAAAHRWPAGTTVRTLRADPDAMSALVRDWSAHRPQHLTGIIWYRLPIARDTLNWRWPTLASVMAGRRPQADLRVLVTCVAPGLDEVRLINRGDDDAGLTAPIALRWADAHLEACDGLAGFATADAGPGALVLRPTPEAVNRALGPGDQRVVAWLRRDCDTEVTAHVDAATPR